MLSDLAARLESAALRGVNLATALLKQEIDRLTPEDTGTLLRNNKIKPAQPNATGVVGAVVNNTDYGPFVEYGVGGRAYNYHKPKGVVAYRGVGARMFTRAFDANKNKIVATINNELKKAIHA